MIGIRARGVGKSYVLPDGSERKALANVDLDIAGGEFVALLGPSGCGKTTLLNILSGLDRDYEGDVRFTRDERRAAAARQRGHAGGPSSHGRDTLPQGDEKSRRAINFSYMFQESRLLPWKTVRDNLRFVLDGDQSASDAKIDGWLARVGLQGVGSLFPSQLSVGMQQRVSLVRALIVEPEVLFMDEPLSALDELTATQMRDELLALWAEQRPTVVFVTHNPLEAVYLADRVMIMTPGPGRILQEIDVSGQLKRPRDPEDKRLWELSRLCVRILRGADPIGIPSES